MLDDIIDFIVMTGFAQAHARSYFSTDQQLQAAAAAQRLQFEMYARPSGPEAHCEPPEAQAPLPGAGRR